MSSETSLNQDLIVFPLVNVSDITWLDFLKKICLFMHVVNNETQIAMITKELIASRVSKKKKIRLTTACNIAPWGGGNCLREFLVILKHAFPALLDFQKIALFGLQPVSLASRL